MKSKLTVLFIISAFITFFSCVASDINIDDDKNENSSSSSENSVSESSSSDNSSSEESASSSSNSENSSSSSSSSAGSSASSNAFIAGHLAAKESVLRSIPIEYINNARNNFHISYQHTSHGTHVSYGLFGLQDYKAGDSTLFGITNNNPTANKLDFHDYALSATGPSDLSTADGDWGNFVVKIRAYLDNPANASINILMYSWCDISDHSIPGYLSSMQTLISEYGTGGTKIGSGSGQRANAVTFIFMTGHANPGSNVGSGLPRNQAELIIDYCTANNYYCLDYYSIDTHDMNDTYWEDAGDNGNSDSYDASNGASGSAYFYGDWQASHTLGTDWFYSKASIGDTYGTPGEHNDQYITANRKAYAMWNILARIAGWYGQ